MGKMSEFRKRPLEIVYRSMDEIKPDPAYVDAIVRRWQKLSGGSALHRINGRSFDDLARGAEVAHAA